MMWQQLFKRVIFKLILLIDIVNNVSQVNNIEPIYDNSELE